MSSHCSLLFYPIKMSQKFVNLSLRLFVLAFVLLAERSTGSFNITRYTTGDVFQNINSTQSCNDSGAKCVFDGVSSPFCGMNCCYCECNSRTPTYVQRYGNCTSEDRLMSILKTQSAIHGCDRRVVIGVDPFPCQGKVLTTLNTAVPGNSTLHFCSWQRHGSAASDHYKLAKNLLTCQVLANESFYLFNGTWKEFPSDEQPLSELNVEIRPDASDFVGVDQLLLKWTADIGKQYDGHIVSLKLRCSTDDKQKKTLNSCLHFKKSGSLTDIKPTSKPPIKSTRVLNSSVQQTSPTEAGSTLSSSLLKVSTPSTARALDVGVTSLADSPPKLNLVVIVLAALAAALFVSLVCVALFCLLQRRKRRFEVRKESKDASNPIYERGASDTLKMAQITIRSGENTEEELPEYQPLVENTKPYTYERTDSLPGYRALSVGQRPTQGVRSSNYLSLIKDDMDEGRDYQTLVKDANTQGLETVYEEDKIPDYQELEERTDSEDSFDSSRHCSMDSKLDYEDPPMAAIMKKLNSPPPRKQKINDLSSDMHDYDEPEGVIVISDHEDNNQQAIKDNIDFHDYADPDDTDEDNTKCHVDDREVPSCYHDYDNPPE